MNIRVLGLVIFVLTTVSAYGQEAANAIPQVNDGTLEHIENFPSEYVSARNIDVWLPDDYSPDKTYAVLYMNDGQTLFDPSMSWLDKEWGVDELMGKLLKENLIKDSIVVGIWNSGLERTNDYFPQKAYDNLSQEYIVELRKELDKSEYTASMLVEIQSDNYLKFLVEELKPFIDKKYSTSPDRDNTFILGSSYGGLISMYAISEYPEVFGGAACLSTHWIGTFDDNPVIAQVVIDYFAENVPDPATHKIYFDYGSETLDQYYKPYQLKVDAIMKANGYDSSNWKTLEFVGDNHSEDSWRKRLDIPLKFLVGH
jgi:enterochelin esterase-like enzyme